MKIITLTTDFGGADWFVGTMKGVILGLAPQVQIVDLTHGVGPGDVRAGAFALAAACRYFPQGTVHVAVVDPGVGSARGAIAVQTRKYLWVGPDNGVLSMALAGEAVQRIHRLECERYLLQPVSRTFHGRDIFAPVAAHLSNGVPLRSLGPSQGDHVRLEMPHWTERAGTLRGEVIYVDRFGNAITNLPNQMVRAMRSPVVRLRNRSVAPVKPCYQAVAPGEPVAVPGSSGFLEIAVNGGSAAARLKLQSGSKLVVGRP